MTALGHVLTLLGVGLLVAASLAYAALGWRDR